MTATPATKLPVLLVVTGPTASGKTALAIQIAQMLKTVIISCDSRQFYREMSIGTAKPTDAELQTVQHYFVNTHSITQPYSVGDYEREVLQLLQELFTQYPVVVMTGGSGLFLRVVCQGLNDFPEVEPNIRNQLTAMLQTQGIDALRALLQQHDPHYCQKVDLNNPQRIIRALEVCLSSGLPYSSFTTGAKAQRPFTCLKIALQWDMQELYRRINQRVEAMMQEGLLQEATQLYPIKHVNALQTVGYQEIFDYLDGKCTLPEAVERIKRNTRRYAKRQMTWLRKEEGIIWADATQPTTVIQLVKQLLDMS